MTRARHWARLQPTLTSRARLPRLDTSIRCRFRWTSRRPGRPSLSPAAQYSKIQAAHARTQQGYLEELRLFGEPHLPLRRPFQWSVRAALARGQCTKSTISQRWSTTPRIPSQCSRAAPLDAGQLSGQSIGSTRRHERSLALGGTADTARVAAQNGNTALNQQTARPPVFGLN